MNKQQIHDLLTQVAQGALSPDKAAQHLGTLPVAELAGDIALDTHRLSRTGLGEVVFGLGKTPEQLVTCVSGIAKAGQPVLCTRVGAAGAKALSQAHPQGIYCEAAGLFALGTELNLGGPWPGQGEVLVVTAGTSDLGVALEAYGTACFWGLQCGLIADVGVAGVHRLTAHLPAMQSARALIVVAGMDGALPSLLGGLLPTPIIAVPSSQGGDNPMGGVAAMLAMLNSCSPGVAVQNVDNGFGAAAFATKMLQHEGPAK